LCGIFYRNMPVFSEFLLINHSMHHFLAKSAFTIILIRGGISLDFNALKKQKAIISLSLSASTLAATSPAVTIPTMISLIKKGYGSDSGVPTVVLASAAIDNLICLTLTNIFLSIAFTSSEILKIVVTGLFLGSSVGYFMWFFPMKIVRHLHFIRTIMLLFSCLAFIFCGEAIGWNSSGVIATIASSIIAPIRWKHDNVNLVIS
uniref:Na_H_Exchanger domain-containing protein n=1 Tax=Dracunculus medinensis TaxID=318479 RepID=A0A0N4U678_DRAME